MCVCWGAGCGGNFLLVPDVFFHLGGLPRAPGLDLIARTQFSWVQESGIRMANAEGKTGQGSPSPSLWLFGQRAPHRQHVFCCPSQESSTPLWGGLPPSSAGGKASDSEFSIRMLTCPQSEDVLPKFALSVIKVRVLSPSALLLCFKFSNWFRTLVRGEGLSYPPPPSPTPNIWQIDSWTWYLGNKITLEDWCFWQMLYWMWPLVFIW